MKLKHFWLRRDAPRWGQGTVYYILNTPWFQARVWFMPWKRLPGISWGKPYLGD